MVRLIFVHELTSDFHQVPQIVAIKSLTLEDRMILQIIYNKTVLVSSETHTGY
jgi:hypothetical protein